MTKNIKIGSSVFFGNMSDYVAKDIDEMIIQDKWLPKGIPVLNMKRGGRDIFFWSPLSKEEFIKNTFDCGVPMRVGKFLVKEFADYIGLTIEDLKRLEPLFNQLDDKHKYEKIIYDAYVENNSFTLTEEQRKNAYNEYKRERDLL